MVSHTTRLACYATSPAGVEGGGKRTRKLASLFERHTRTLLLSLEGVAVVHSSASAQDARLFLKAASEGECLRQPCSRLTRPGPAQGRRLHRGRTSAATSKACDDDAIGLFGRHVQLDGCQGGTRHSRRTGSHSSSGTSRLGSGCRRRAQAAASWRHAGYGRWQGAEGGHVDGAQAIRPSWPSASAQLLETHAQHKFPQRPRAGGRSAGRPPPSAVWSGLCRRAASQGGGGGGPRIGGAHS